MADSADTRGRTYLGCSSHCVRFCGGVLGLVFFVSAGAAAEKPPLSADAAPVMRTQSRISATIEFGLPALAAAIERDIPKRLATIDERINCVHRRVLGFQVSANCDVWGYVERTSGVSLYGRGDRVFGAVSIHGVAEGQGANRFTARIHGETEATATVEVEARPQLRKDWSLDLNFSDSFRWSEPPYLHVLGRDIPLAEYAEPRIKTQLDRVRSRAIAAARRIDLRDKAAKAWAQAFEPISLAAEPPTWLQLTPQAAAFAGVRASSKTLSGTLELAGTAETVIGGAPPAVSPTALPSLGTDVSTPGSFELVLPVRISYNTLRRGIQQALSALPKNNAIRDVQIYPSAGKLVVGLRIAAASEPDPAAGEWIYLSGKPRVDTDKKTIGFAEFDADDTIRDRIRQLLGDDQLLTQLQEQGGVSYGVAYDNLLDAASEKLTRPLKNGFRMEGRLTSAKLDNVSLLADGPMILIHASGELKILYGL